jgi:hypothetical protein
MGATGRVESAYGWVLRNCAPGCGAKGNCFAHCVTHALGADCFTPLLAPAG